MGKKVLRYTEEQFISLLENMVKRVQKEQLMENKKEKSRQERINENLEKIRKQRKK